MDDGGSHAMSVIYVIVSVANDIVRSTTAADHGYHSFGEMAFFLYCLLQKIKKSPSLPLVEQREECLVPNHARYRAIHGKVFLSGTRVMAVLAKVGSQ